jgi:hypothetical protein
MAFKNFLISYSLYRSNIYYRGSPSHELQSPEDGFHTPPLTEHYYTNEGSVGSEHIHEEQLGPRT